MRASIRNLFTRLMLDKGITVPAIGGKPTHRLLKRQEAGVTENHYGEMANRMVEGVPAELDGHSDL